MDRKTEIQEQLQKFRKNLDNPKLANFRTKIETQIKALEAELKALEDKEKPKPKPSPVPMPVTKKPEAPTPPKAEKKPSSKPTTSRNEVIGALQKSYGRLTAAEIKKMSKADYNGLKSDMKSEAEKAGAGSMAGLWAGQYLKTIEGKKSAKEAAKPAPAKAAKQPEPAKPAEATYSWLRKVEEGEWEAAKPVDFCGGRLIKIASDISLEVKTEGKKGEYILVNQDGYPHAVLTEHAAKSFCQSAGKKKEVVGKLEQENADLAKKVEELKAELQTAKKTESTTAPSKKSDDKPTTKRANCSTAALKMGELTGLMIKFVKENTKKGWLGVDREVDGIYITRGEDRVLLAKVVDWGALKKTETWYRICPETFNKTKVDAPKAGSYKRIVSEGKLKELRTTNEPQPTIYNKCADIYRSFYECTKDGSCNAAMTKKIKDAYHTCGDLYQQGTVVPAYMKDFHDEVKRTRKTGEKYHEAMIRVSREIRASK